MQRGVFVCGIVRLNYGAIMSELDEQKARIDWLKDLFKVYIAALFAIAAGLLSLISNMNFGYLFYVGIVVLVIVGLLATLKAKEIHAEILKLKGM